MTISFLQSPLPVEIGPYSGTLHIHRDERGLAWIDDSNVKVVEVVLDHLQGQSAEAVQASYPHLTFAQIHAALAYYYDHQQELDDLIRAGREAYQSGHESSENATWRLSILGRTAAKDKESPA